MVEDSDGWVSVVCGGGDGGAGSSDGGFPSSSFKRFSTCLREEKKFLCGGFIGTNV